MKTNNLLSNIYSFKLLLKGISITAIVISVILFVNVGISYADVNYFEYAAPGRSVVQLVNSASIVNNAYEYDSFGNIKTATENVTNNYKYVGEQLDIEPGLINLRNRYYDSTTGRFISKDPISGSIQSPTTINPYPYCSNNPTSNTDTKGLDYINPAPPSLIDLAFLSGGAITGAAGYLIGNWVFNKPDTGTGLLGATIGGALGGEVLYRFGSPTLAGMVSGGASNAIDQGLSGKSFNTSQFLYSTGVGGIMGFLGGQIATPGFSTVTGNGGTNSLLGQTAILFEEDSGQLNWLASSSQVAQYSSLSALPSVGLGALTPPSYNDASNLANMGIGDLESAFNFAAISWGGVSLNKTAQLLLNIQDVGGATFDQATGQVILYGKQNVTLPNMDLDDLAVAISSEYGLHMPAADPGVSIGTDPSDVPGQMKVRYDGDTLNTGFGAVMFQSDWLLKKLTLGKDNTTGQPFGSSVSGYENMLNRYRDGGVDGWVTAKKNPLSRFWFTPKQITLAQNADGSAMEFSTTTMQLLTSTELIGIADTDPYAAAFATEVTNDYDSYANEFPVLQQLTRLGKITAVVKWIKDNNIPFDLSFFSNYVPATGTTPQYTPQTSVSTSHNYGSGIILSLFFYRNDRIGG